MSFRALNSSTAGAVGKWDLDNAVFTGTPVNLFMDGENTKDNRGVFVDSTGTRFYISDATSDKVHQYSLSTAWDVSTFSYVGSVSILSNSTTCKDLFFKSDGTKLFVVEDSANQLILEYGLSTAWDITTASYTTSFNVATQTSNPVGLFFKPDGTVCYMTGGTSPNVDVWQYSLSTAWDISTASLSTSYDLYVDLTHPAAIFFESDGDYCYIASSNDYVYKFSLSTAWDISTATKIQTLDISDVLPTVSGLFFKDDGSRMIISDRGSDITYQYDLSTAWDLSTASFTEPTTDYLVTQNVNPTAFNVSDDGGTLFVFGNISDTVDEYTLSTAWDVGSATYVDGYSPIAQDNTPAAMEVKPDGTKLYIVGEANDTIYQYSLSVAWDVSTTSYDSKSLYIGDQATNPAGVSFSEDGTKVYLVAGGSDSIYQYNLSTAWDISTGTYSGNSVDVSGQDTSPTDLYIDSSGTRLYLVGGISRGLFSYTLSTAFDISTASYDSKYFYSALVGNPRSVAFKEDGTKMLLSCNGSETITTYEFQG
jgi:6-phosphogluconolactonase (cycloisomerase 2 family)